jgi:histidinol-phosphate/aromatic aminotransferase/cobyric acid decarboxylase-like protein
MLKRIVANRPVLRPEPTFGEYQRMFPNAETYPDSIGVDLAALAKRMPDGGVVVFVTPNSPTGTVIGTEWILACAVRHPRTFFIVDESFVDFSDETPMVTRLERDPQPNVFVIKSLSKSLGVPGLRLGYVYSCDPAIVRVLDDEIPIWNMAGPAEFFLELMLKYRPDFERSLLTTKADRAMFATRLAGLPSVETVHPSGGNFLLLTLTGGSPSVAGRVRAELLARFSIDVKDVSTRLSPPAPRLRAAVRLPADNARFCASLDEVSLVASA